MAIPLFIKFISDLAKSLYRFYCVDSWGLRAIQDKRFKQTLEYVYTNITFYKNKFLRSKVELNKITNLDQIKELPFTDPDDLFSKPPNLRANTKDIYVKLRSSGTTGRPKDVYLSAFDWGYVRRLAYLRMFFSSGCFPFHKTLFLTPHQSSFHIRGKWFHKLGLMREHISCSYNPRHAQSFLFSQYKPDVLNCLTADGIALADFIKSDHKVFNHKAKYIFTTGEILTDKDRQIMLSVLGKRIVDFYASTEAGIIAWECLKGGGYHINADQLYVEIVNGDKLCRDGEAGEVVLTTLTPCCSPLVRYRTGDIAVMECGKCKCGSWFPRLSRIHGRKNDFLTNTRGEKISPYILMVAMDNIKEVKEYRIYQSGRGEYTIYLAFDANEISRSLVERRVKEKYIKVFGPGSIISIVDLSNLPTFDTRTKGKVIASYIDEDEVKD